jgi:hypothetical protein
MQLGVIYKHHELTLPMKYQAWVSDGRFDSYISLNKTMISLRGGYSMARIRCVIPCSNERDTIYFGYAMEKSVVYLSSTLVSPE